MRDAINNACISRPHVFAIFMDLWKNHWRVAQGNIYAYIIYTHYKVKYTSTKPIEEMQKLIFTIPSDMTGYDWTYLSGTSIYDTKDCNTENPPTDISSITQKLEKMDISRIEKIQTKIQRSHQEEDLNLYYKQQKKLYKQMELDEGVDQEDYEDHDVEEEEKINAHNTSEEGKTDQDDDKENDIYDELPGNLERLHSNQIEVAWLLTINELEFIMTITPTPGTYNVYIYIYIYIYFFFFCILYI